MIRETLESFCTIVSSRWKDQMEGTNSIKEKIGLIPDTATKIFRDLKRDFSLTNHRSWDRRKVTTPKTNSHFSKFALTEDNIASVESEIREFGAKHLLAKLSNKECKNLLESKLLNPNMRAECFRAFYALHPRVALKPEFAPLKEEIMQSSFLSEDIARDPNKLASKLTEMLDIAKAKGPKEYYEVVDYLFGEGTLNKNNPSEKGYFHIAHLSLEQNEALQKTLIDRIPQVRNGLRNGPPSPQDLLTCTLLYSLKAASADSSAHILSDTCMLANLFLKVAQTGFENPKNLEPISTCLNFLQGNTQPVLVSRAMQTENVMSDSMLHEGIWTIGFSKDSSDQGLKKIISLFNLLNREKPIIPQSLSQLISSEELNNLHVSPQKDVPREEVTKLLSDEIKRQRAHNLTVQWICNNVNLQKKIDPKHLKNFVWTDTPGFSNIDLRKLLFDNSSIYRDYISKGYSHEEAIEQSTFTIY